MEERKRVILKIHKYMIFELIIGILTYIIAAVGNYLPGGGTVPLLLPWGTDAWFSEGINGYKVLAQSFPPMGVVLSAFLIYIGFRIALRLLKGVPILGRTLS